jgi:Fe-Mn family superoxide dismutase
MRLHELYFGNLAKGGVTLSERALKTKIVATWGSFENWEKEFRGMAAMRGIGWVILAHDKKDSKLCNIWINEHDGGLLAGTQPLLVMDVFEHAFMLDYGIKRADYINAFMSSIDWHSVEERV